MGCGSCCLKCLMTLFNIIFGIIGAVILAVGIFLKVGLVGTITTLLKDVFTQLQTSGQSFGVNFSTDNKAFNLDELVTILDPLAIVFIVIGAFILGMVILGGIGMCCKSSCILYIYAIILLALFLAQLVLVCLFFTGAVDNKIEEQLVKTIKENYAGTDAYDIYSLLWNLMHQQLKCCGYNNCTDFKGAIKWTNTRSLDSGGSVTLTCPISCCISGQNNIACATEPTVQTSYFNTGCWNEIKKATDSYKDIVIGVIAAILALQFICAVGAIVVGKEMSKKSVDSV